ncbi:MAG: nicotinate-nucleotide diphosphorylase [Spirochaetes bacterium]|nr:nicotinate-nucleotide diphosphorylase [Spirochaetota bacterium]
MNEILIKKFIEEAISEDIGFIDHSTFPLFRDKLLKAEIKVKSESGILCGIELLKNIFLTLNSLSNNLQSKKNFKELNIINYKEDGDLIKKGDIVLTIEGNAEVILKGERVSLNLLSYLSGISTKAFRIKRLWEKKIDEIENRKYNSQINNDIKTKFDKVITIIKNIKITDTRKILPLYRQFVKYAVRVGGLFNHRFNLSDGIMLKENHIKAAGSIKKALSILRENSPLLTKIECEVENFEEFLEAYEGKADVIMLDEFDIKEYKKVSEFLKQNEKNFLLEVSGNINEEKISNLIDIIIETEIPIDIISIGTSLTLNVEVIDFSMKYS